MKKKPVNTYLTPKTIAQIEKTFPTTYHGLRTTIESFFVLRNYSMKEIRGTFNDNEVVAMLKIYKGTTFAPTLASRQTLQLAIEDGEQYQRIVSENGADLKELLNKIELLTNTQAFWLLFELQTYWSAPVEIELETFLRSFA